MSENNQTKNKILLILILALALVITIHGALADTTDFLDDFNRANSSSVGWTSETDAAGFLSIESNQFKQADTSGSSSNAYEDLSAAEQLDSDDQYFYVRLRPTTAITANIAFITVTNAGTFMWRLDIDSTNDLNWFSAAEGAKTICTGCMTNGTYTEVRVHGTNWTNTKFDAISVAGTNYTDSNTGWTWDTAASAMNRIAWDTGSTGQGTVFMDDLHINTTSAATPTLTLTLAIQNDVTATNITGLCTDVNNGTANTKCNTTGTTTTYNDTEIPTDQLYNITWYSIGNGSGAGYGTYYNQTTTNYNFSTTDTQQTGTWQAWLNTSVSQLYTNNTIQSFNITNNRTSNQTTIGWVMIKANNGSNNLQASVTGNYSVNDTCVATLLTTDTCTIGGVYDNRYTFGVLFGGSPGSGFSVSARNTSINAEYDNTTTGTNLIIPTLQGYYYNFTMTSSNYATANATLESNASAQSYNFTGLLSNTFNLTIYNEVTENQIIQDFSIELISEAYSNNYTLTNGSGNISLLIPSEYTIRYRNSNHVERDYIILLNNGSFVNINLYSLNTSEASTITATVSDTTGDPVEGAIITLLRYYVSCNCYRIVEMASTSYSGEAIIYVDAYDGFYRWSISYENVTRFLSTSAENIATDTRIFTINLGQNYYESYVGLSSLVTTISYNRTTGSLVYTWNDAASLVTQGCLEAEYLDGTRYLLTGPNCSSGTSGTIILGLDNTTRYKYRGYVDTNTEFSSYNTQTGWIDPSPEFDFGNLGVFLGFGVLSVLTMIGATISAWAILVLTVVGVIILTYIELMPFQTTFLVGLGALIIGIGVYLFKNN